MYKKFAFSPLAILNPKSKLSVDLASQPMRDLFKTLFGEEHGQELFNEAIERAETYAFKYSTSTAPLTRYQFADGLAYLFWAKTDAGTLLNGYGLPTDMPYACKLAWTRILRTARAVLERFATSYAQAKEAFEKLNLSSEGTSEYHNTSESAGTSTDKYKSGLIGISEAPTGESTTDTSATTGGETASFGGFSGIWSNVGQFIDGGIYAPKNAVLDALFDALFEPYEQKGDFVTFGDVKINIWG